MVAFPASTIAFYAQLLETFAFEERIGNSVVVREPVASLARSRRGTTRCIRSSRRSGPRSRRAARSW